MSTLAEGCRYGLSTTSSGSNKTCIYLKLTDSSLRSIEECLKFKNVDTRPSIKYEGQQGIIKIPSLKSNDNPDGNRIFKFTLSDLPGDAKGSFDCVQQRRGEHLTMVGSMSKKITISATDETYQQTKEKMEHIDLESKKQCAKVIKAGGPGIGRKVKKVIRGQTSATLHSQSRTNQINSQPKEQHPGHKRMLPSSVHDRPTLSGHDRPPGHDRPSGHDRPTTLPYKSAFQDMSKVSPLSSKPLPKVNPQTTVKGTSKLNTAIMNLSYRDRIIHLLALRPYKKPELLIRLQKDGIKEKDKNSLSTILSQVAISKDNTYTLKKHIYSEIKEDWLTYTDSDRQLLRKRVPNCTNGADSPARISPNYNSINHRGTSSASQLEDRSQEPPTKRTRYANGTSSNLPKPDAPSSTNSLPDYISKYTSITSLSQRHQYKEDFNHEYEEYLKTHNKVGIVSKRFEDLQSSLKQYPEGSPDHELIRNKIYHEYLAKKQDSEYVAKKKRCEYLHNKLQHIKKLVAEYDQTLEPSH